MKKLIFATPVTATTPSLGLLFYRLAIGGFMLVGHGWGKLGLLSDPSKFPDPLGLGAMPSLGGALFAELLCAALVILGLGTRLAVIPLMFTMAIAGFVVHAEGPLFLPGQGAKEPALLYMAAYGLLLFTGAGRFSIDRRIGAGS